MDLPAHPACLDDKALLEACQIDRFRGSGPGGQHRNKVETGIRLTHKPTGVSVSATERRSQHDNLQAAAHRLRLALACRVRTAAPAGREPSALWLSRRGADGRIPVNDQHPDLPVLLAEALDFLRADGWRPAEAAARLGVSASQLIKLIQKEPEAFALVNRERAALGLGKLS